MLTYEEALTQILGKTTVLPAQEIELLDSVGLNCAEDVYSPLSLPRFANSAMDGYAVRFDEVRPGQELPIAGESAAGAATVSDLIPGTAQRILTGAPMPVGADTVLPQEDVTVAHGKLRITEFERKGQHVRGIGEDIAEGARVVSADTLIRPAEIGLLAAIGKHSVRAVPRPRVAIISTGDELQELGLPLGSSQIYNSNSYALAAQVMEAGGIVTHRVHARDTPDALRAALDTCADVDLLLTSGGVSVGDHDHVKAVISERAPLEFWRVAIRPGKPLAFGAWGDGLFFGLPGNPVSAMVTFELFVRPSLLKMRGETVTMRPHFHAQMVEEARHETGRQSFQRAKAWWEPEGCKVRPLVKQGSHQMQALAEANALLIIPQDVAEISVGEFATVMLLQ